MPKSNSHCSFCGAGFADGQPWPRKCATCQKTSYVNPVPVAVVLVPVGGGLLGVRRSIDPGKGLVALPGGFINLGESWQAAGAREVFEETGITIDPGRIRDHTVLSAPDGTVLIFGIAPDLGQDLPTLAAEDENDEVSELAIIRGPDGLAFSLHAEVVRRFFAREDSRGS